MTPGEAEVELRALIEARYSLIYVVASEEIHVEAAIAAIAASRGAKALYWGVSRGLVDADGTIVDGEMVDPIPILRKIYETREPAIYVLRDFHAYHDEPVVRRWLRDLGAALKNADDGQERTVIVLSPVLKLPTEIEKEFAVLDWPLPDKAAISTLVESLIVTAGADKAKVFGDTPEQIAEAALGLTATEAENALAKTLVQHKRLIVRPILNAKKEIIRKSGMLDFIEVRTSAADIGGLEVIMPWAKSHRRYFTDEARAFGVDTPRGAVLVGPAGTGKTLVSTTLGAIWELPVVKWDVGSMMGSLVGESEANMRRAIKTTEGIAPCIALIDEIEKAVAGSGTDTSGVTTRMVGMLLSWMSDKTAPVYVIATANDVSKLANVELLRAGRFDRIWLVDLPHKLEREAILAVHLRKRKRNPEHYDLVAVAVKTDGFSGAELERVVKEGLERAFDDGRDLTTEDMLVAAESATPLSRQFPEKVAAVRDWAQGRAVPASLPPPSEGPRRPTRRLKLEGGN